MGAPDTEEKAIRFGCGFVFGVAVPFESPKGNRDDGPPNFVGNIVQGPPLGRFIYIDIGNQSSWWTWMKSWLPSFAGTEATTKGSNRWKANGNFSEPK